MDISLNRSIIQRRKQICILNLIVSLIMYFFVTIGGLNEAYGLMRVYSVWTMLICVLLILSEVRFNGLSIMLIFFVGAMTRLSYPSFDMAQRAMDGWKYYEQLDYTSYIFPATVAMNIYYMIFILAATFFAKGKILSLDINAVLDRIKFINVLMVILYVIGVVARSFPIIFSFSATLGSFVTRFPQLVLLILAFYCARNEKFSSRLLFYSIVGFELVYSIVFGFHKGPIVIDLFFIFLYAYLRSKYKCKKFITPRLIVITVVVALFLNYIIFPFISIKRVESGWDPITNMTYYNYSNADILRSVFDTAKEKVEDSEDDDMENSVVDRLNSIKSNAYFYMGAQIRGHDQSILLSGLLGFIPPIFRSNIKVDPQGMMTVQYMQSGTTKLSSTSLHSGDFTGLFGGAYFWGGWIGAMIMCFVNAFAFVAMFNYATKWQNNLLSLLVLFLLLFNTISCFEETSDGGVLDDLNYLYYVAFIYVSNKIFKVKPIHDNKDNKQTQRVKLKKV